MLVYHRVAAPNLLWAVYQPDREPFHLLVLSKSAREFAADAPKSFGKHGCQSNLSDALRIRFPEASQHSENGRKNSFLKLEITLTVTRLVSTSAPTASGDSNLTARNRLSHNPYSL